MNPPTTGLSQTKYKNTQQRAFTRQATILRKNLFEWDRMLRSPQVEDWGTTIGRLNAALNQTGNLDRSIDDVLEHFVYVPKKSTANPQDIPFFLSTRLAEAVTDKKAIEEDEEDDQMEGEDPVKLLSAYEIRAAKLAAEYEENMTRF
eukprot:CAMPEP_0194046378 /NCGR_PEP_ID=MMETSP0009_2-20130614/21067_1 /TAXON_ID=210454 /ORGANISM="Grammatophora oceanica, Strain CCMP 410" /LENGTH=146 /DNA_ID=CAMNT_0038691645 /DNA_START=19 /DNA_END=459 /DNA_ORIENTATION=-